MVATMAGRRSLTAGLASSLLCISTTPIGLAAAVPDDARPGSFGGSGDGWERGCGMRRRTSPQGTPPPMRGMPRSPSKETKTALPQHAVARCKGENL